MLRTQKDVAEVSQPQESLSSSEHMQLRYYNAQDWFARNRNAAYIALGVLVAAIAGARDSRTWLTPQPEAVEAGG